MENEDECFIRLHRYLGMVKIIQLAHYSLFDHLIRTTDSTGLYLQKKITFAGHLHLDVSQDHGLTSFFIEMGLVRLWEI